MLQISELFDSSSYIPETLKLWSNDAGQKFCYITVITGQNTPLYDDNQGELSRTTRTGNFEDIDYGGNFGGHTAPPQNFDSHPGQTPNMSNSGRYQEHDTDSKSSKNW